MFAIGRRCVIWIGMTIAAGHGQFVVAAEPSPRIIGFERMYAAAEGDQVAAGQLLLGELNCTSCHQADPSLAGVIQRKPAPVLDTVCSRVKPDYLLKFLSDPQATKPGTTMPNVLASLSQADREPVVEALVHFLATTGTTAHAAPLRHAAQHGDLLFHSVGCLACHDPRTERAPASLPTSIPLGTPSRKYTLPGLTQFLIDPLAVRPGGRMPHLNLSATEARDIASFLLSDLEMVSGLQYAYYEGEWEKLPNFSKLTPVAVGDAVNFDLSVVRRRDNFALRFAGNIQIPQSGDYLFLLGSDDGSRLLIDDKPIVVNDGVHPFEQKRKKTPMTAGAHSVVVEYFEQEGEESLQVDFEGPGMQQRPLESLLGAPEKQSTQPDTTKQFAIDPAKAAQGREYFVSLGCAACHSLKVDGSPIQPAKQHQPLAKLASAGGCVEGAAQTPDYRFSDRQRRALTAALATSKNPIEKPTAEQTIRAHLVRFNCVTCHERNKFGGVEPAREVFFQSEMPEMGDEGRIPPNLTGVGAKLTSEWLKTIFEKGADDRPYMFARMPKFGMTNVGELVPALAQADSHLTKPAPDLIIGSEDEKRFKAAGRRLVGAQGFSCIKCHTFAGKRSSGIQAISLTMMKGRLRPEWFYHYLQNPMAYRPGTRMPTPFPDGQTTLPGVLDGTVNHQIAAIWSYLADGDKATLPVGLVTGKMELMAFDQAVIFRNFIEGAGTRAIGVGYPEKLNLAFDAEKMCLAMLWQGAFLDAARHWSARGAGFEKPLGDNVLRLPDGPPLAVLNDPSAAWPSGSAKDLGYHFEGYRLGEKSRPTFLYSWQGIRVEDELRPEGDQDVFVMRRALTLTSEHPPAHAWLRAAGGEGIDEAVKGVYKIDHRWTLTVRAPGKPLRRQMADGWELLVPVSFDSNKARIELIYDW